MVFTFVAFDLWMYHVNECVRVEVWNPLLNVTELVQRDKESVYLCRDNGVTSTAVQRGIIGFILLLSSFNYYLISGMLYTKRIQIGQDGTVGLKRERKGLQCRYYSAESYSFLPNLPCALEL